MVGSLAIVFPIHRDLRASQSSVIQTPSESINSPCYFSEIFRYEGWDIPGLKGSTPTKVHYTFDYALGVTAVGLKPGPAEQSLVLLRCSAKSPGRIEFRLRPVKVIELWRCDYKGKVFAYGARYGLQRIVGRKREDLLEGMSILFYDLDGSGKFVSMKYQSGLLLKAIEVPDWVKLK
jgi:hypothetical protein